MWQQNKDLEQKHQGWELEAFLIAEHLKGVGKEEKETEKERKVGTTPPSSGSRVSNKRFWESASAILLTRIRTQISIIYQHLWLAPSFPFTHVHNKRL